MPPARTKKGRLPGRFDVQLWPTQYLDSDAESAAEETEQPKSEEPTDIFQRHHKQLSRASDPKARAEHRSRPASQWLIAMLDFILTTHLPKARAEHRSCSASQQLIAMLDLILTTHPPKARAELARSTRAI